METIGQKIKRIREEYGILQKVSAKSLHISPSYLSEIERDGRRPSVEVLKRIAHYLKFESVHDFLDGVVIEEMGVEWVIRKEDCCCD